MKKGMLYWEDDENDILSDKNKPSGDESSEAGNAEADAGNGRKNTSEKINIGKEIISWILTIAVAFFIGYGINHWVLIKAEVPTGSMENTIMPGNNIWGFRLAYLFSAPERGDIVMFLFPDNESQIYVKRVIGLPGETVEIKNGSVYIDGHVIEEDYLKETMVGNYGPYVVPEDSYFMMGDNRNISKDSRFWVNTYVSKEKIIAKVFLIDPVFLRWLN